MSLYIFDTDHLSLHQRDPRLFLDKIASLHPERIAVTVVSVEEQLRGRMAQIREARLDHQLQASYRHLRETVEGFSRYFIVDYDGPAGAIFNLLRQQKIRIGTRDLRIAAIALSVGGILVTRNNADFGQVPGLLTEDWTK